MKIEIFPKSGIGIVALNMTREQVREAIAAPATPFLTSPSSSTPADAYDDLGIYIYYDCDFHVEAIELASPAEPVLFGKNILGQPVRDIDDCICEYDNKVERDGAGIISKQLGISIYAPGALKDPDTPIEAVMVFRDGYYDSK